MEFITQNYKIVTAMNDNNLTLAVFNNSVVCMLAVFEVVNGRLKYQKQKDSFGIMNSWNDMPEHAIRNKLIDIFNMVPVPIERNYQQQQLEEVYQMVLTLVGEDNV